MWMFGAVDLHTSLTQNCHFCQLTATVSHSDDRNSDKNADAFKCGTIRQTLRALPVEGQ